MLLGICLDACKIMLICCSASARNLLESVENQLGFCEDSAWVLLRFCRTLLGFCWDSADLGHLGQFGRFWVHLAASSSIHENLEESATKSAKKKL